MSLLPSANPCCQSCNGTTVTLEEILEAIGGGGCTITGDGDPVSPPPSAGCHYWDFTNKRLYVADTVGGAPTWREIIG